MKRRSSSRQKMLITRLTGTAVTYGGYVNVSRQNIDFSTPDALDVVINDLAAAVRDPDRGGDRRA